LEAESGDDGANSNENEGVSKVRVKILPGEIFENVLRNQSSQCGTNGHQERKKSLIKDEIFSDPHMFCELFERN